MISGIYVIINIVNGKLYIGQSVNVCDRIYKHSWTLNNNCHKNVYLQQSFNKHTSENFKFSIIEEVEEGKLDERERFWIKEYNCIHRDFGYNSETGGSANKRASKEAKEKMSLKRKLRVTKESTRLKMSKSLKGRVFSEESKRKMSIAMKGRTFSEETKMKMRLAKLGKKQTVEHIFNAAEGSRRAYRNGTRKSWNEGLTKATDVRVLNNYKTRRKNHAEQPGSL